MYANKIIDIRTGKIYNSAKEVSDEFNIPHSTIRCWVNGTRKNYSTFRLLKTKGDEKLQDD
jgi:hypothetical protein